MRKCYKCRVEVKGKKLFCDKCAKKKVRIASVYKIYDKI